MELTIDFRTILAALSWFAAAIAVLSLLLVVRASFLRRAALRRAAQIDRLRAQWEPVLNGPPSAPRAQLPPIPRALTLEWMQLWNQAQERACAENDAAARRRRLNDIASHKNMRVVALLWTRRHDVVDRLAAVTMLGYLREAGAPAILRPLCDSPDALLSIAAAHALLQIDNTFAERFVMLVAARADWASGKVMAVVRQERDLLAAPMVRLCRTAPVPRVRALVPYLAYAGAQNALPAVHELLESSVDAETLARALKVLRAVGSAADARAAATLAAHQSWRVRVQAANTLGKLGGAAHIAILTPMLDDAHWWVRYRAAQALAAIADRCNTDLTPILYERTDPFARDALAHVIAQTSARVQGVAS